MTPPPPTPRLTSPHEQLQEVEAVLRDVWRTLPDTSTAVSSSLDPPRSSAPGYTVTVVGRSLGAGVAVLLSLMLREVWLGVDGCGWV